MEYEIDANESVSAAVVRAVSAVEGRDPCSLRPLAHSLDPGALDLLFAAGADGSSRTGGRLSFVHSNCRVAIENGEFLSIQLLDPDLRAPSD